MLAITKLMSMSEVAEYLGVSVDTVRRIHKRGELAFSLIGGNWKISLDDLIRYYESQKVLTQPSDGCKKKKVKLIRGEVKPIGYNKNGKPYWV